MSRTSQSVTVIEFGPERIKVLTGRRQAGRFDILRRAVIPCTVTDPDPTDALRAACAEHAAARATVLVCLARQLVTFRQFELPSVDEGEVADMVALQIGKQTPYAREEIVFDYRLAPSTRAGYSRVVLAIVQQAALRQRFRLLEGAGLEPWRVTVSSEGLLGWALSGVVPENEAGAVAVLDVDSGGGELAVLRDGALLFTRALETGAEATTAPGAPSHAMLADEVAQGLEAYKAEAEGQAVARLIVTGAITDGPWVPVLEQRLAGVSLTVKPGPGSDAGGAVTGSDKPVSWAALLGLAGDPETIEFNLVPDSVGLKTRLVRKARELTTLAALLMALAVGFSFWGILRVALRSARLKRLQAAVEAAQPQVREVERMREFMAIVGERQRLRGWALGGLHAVQRSLPEGVVVEQIAIDTLRGSVALSGSAPTLNEVRGFEKAMADSPLLEGAKVERTERDKGRQRFQKLTAQLERKP